MLQGRGFLPHRFQFLWACIPANARGYSMSFLCPWASPAVGARKVKNIFPAGNGDTYRVTHTRVKRGLLVSIAAAHRVDAFMRRVCWYASHFVCLNLLVHIEIPSKPSRSFTTPLKETGSAFVRNKWRGFKDAHVLEPLWGSGSLELI